MNQTQRENHTAKEQRLQVIFPLDLGLKLPEDDSLRLLIEITEEMDWDESGIQRVSGKGCRKSKLQKDLEKLEEYQNRREQYSRKKETLHGRASYSKTDHDATFMRMKEDHMKNGQLKPGYNLQLGVEGEFIVTAGLFSERSDTLTVLPLLEHFQEKTGELPNRLITDSGYESEENYTRLEEMGIEAYIKPVNYEISKTKKYQRDRYKAENMPYDEETDSFICPNGNTLTAIGTAHRKSKSGFLSEVTLYRCTECRNCPLKAECTKSKNGRTIQRSKVLQRQREQSRERITSELGIQLRVNRSIQSEGTFGVLKQDWGFRRFLRRGQKNVYTEILIYAFAFNIQKLYAKDTNQRHGVILHQLKNAS